MIQFCLDEIFTIKPLVPNVSLKYLNVFCDFSKIRAGNKSWGTIILINFTYLPKVELDQPVSTFQIQNWVSFI